MSLSTNEFMPGKPGKLPVRTDSRTFDLSKYLEAESLHITPHAYDWTVKKTSPWGMMDNWTLSDCTCAAAGHMIECWTANSATEAIIEDAAVLNAYIALSGYDPATGKNDNGVVLLDAMNYWRKTGVGSHKIKAFATINWRNHDLLRAAVYGFGGIYVGLNLPNTVIKQAIWDLVPGAPVADTVPGSFGGHAVTVLAYDATYLTCISWGAEKKITWAFWDKYCDEVYAVITEDFLHHNKTPLGFNVTALESDLLGLTREKHTLVKELVETQSSSADGHSGGKGGAKGIASVPHDASSGAAAGAKGIASVPHNASASGAAAGAKGIASVPHDASAGRSAGATGEEGGAHKTFGSGKSGGEKGAAAGAKGIASVPHDGTGGGRGGAKGKEDEAKGIASVPHDGSAGSSAS